MTVKEVRKILFGPSDQLTVSVDYNGDEYDITEQSPVSDAFADYMVEDVSCPLPFRYRIHLKQEYVKKEA